MKRKLFFILEKLEIKRSERIAVSALLLLIVAQSVLLAMSETDANYSKEEYKELEQVFKKKSEQIEKEKDLIMARYKPTREVPVSMSVREDQGSIPNLPDTTAEEESASAKEININTATNERLQELPGVGPAYAERIISWREENGVFESKDQLLEIKGIGEKRLAKIKPLITL